MDGEVNQYGNHVTHKMKDGYVWYSTDYVSGDIETSGTWTQTSETEYYPLGQTTKMTNGESNSVDVTYYWYYLDTLSENPSGEKVGIAKGSMAYDVIAGDEDKSYWLASTEVDAEKRAANWWFMVVFYDDVDCTCLWGSQFGSADDDFGVRPVVSLKSGIIPVLKSTDNETGISTYEI